MDPKGKFVADAAALLARTEQVALSVRNTAVASAKEREVTHTDWMLLGLHSKLIATSNAVRLLTLAGLFSEALGLNRVALEASLFIEGLVMDPVGDCEVLRKKLAKANGGTAQHDAQKILDSFAGQEKGLLATLYYWWTMREKQKAANDALQCKGVSAQSRAGAKATVSSIDETAPKYLSPPIWALLKEKKHWHPIALDGDGTKALLRRIGLEKAYIAEFRFGSACLHASDAADYLNGELRVEEPRWWPVASITQRALCQATLTIDAEYHVGKRKEVKALGAEGNMLRQEVPGSAPDAEP